MTTPDQVDAVRRFNRFHTRWVGALNEHLLDSGYTLPQVRVLYEIAHERHAAPISARELARRLRVDTGYLSRLLAGLVNDGLIQRAPSPGNAKRLQLSLTARGRDVSSRLDAAASREVEGLLAALGDRQRAELVAAMAEVRRLLGDEPTHSLVTLRDPAPGDIGWVVHRSGSLAADAYGWNLEAESLVAEIVGQFIRRCLPLRERFWVAQRDAQIVGWVLLEREDDASARMRLLQVEPHARGQGLGRQLVGECLRFAAAAGYRQLRASSVEGWAASARVLEGAGFGVVDRTAYRRFGRDLVVLLWAKRW